MLILKIAIVIVILFLLRKHLVFLRPIWPECIGLLVGGLIGWLYAAFFLSSGNMFESLVGLGFPRVLIKPAFALLGSLVTVGPVAAAIRSLFPS